MDERALPIQHDSFTCADTRWMRERITLDPDNCDGSGSGGGGDSSLLALDPHSVEHVSSGCDEHSRDAKSPATTTPAAPVVALNGSVSVSAAAAAGAPAASSAPSTST